MKKNQILFNKKQIRNTRDGHNLNSKYWQNWKKSLPLLPLDLIEIAIGMILGDGSMYKKKIDALIKFEQGYKQTEFLIHSPLPQLRRARGLNYLKVIALWLNLVNESS